MNEMCRRANEREELSVSHRRRRRARRLKQRRIPTAAPHRNPKPVYFYSNIHTFNRTEEWFRMARVEWRHHIHSHRCAHTQKQWRRCWLLISMHAKRITEPPLARTRWTIVEKGRWRHIQHVAACGWIASHTCYADTFNVNEQNKKKNKKSSCIQSARVEYPCIELCVCGCSCSV